LKNLASQEEFKDIPLHLIDFEGQVFKVNQDALKMLKSIDDEIIVVSIVGKARTGKSYLMNLLLDNIGKSGVSNKFTKGINVFYFIHFKIFNFRIKEYIIIMYVNFSV
jgi:hypothetical protein